MNLVTKILVIFNLFFAVAVLFVAATWYTTQENWKRRWDKDTRSLAVVIKKAESRLREVTFERTSAESSLQVLQSKLDDLQTKNEEISSKVALKETELSAADLKNSQHLTQIQALGEKVAQLQDSLKGARQRNSELNHIAQVSRAVAFSLNVKLSETSDDLHNALTNITKKEEKINELAQKLDEKSALLALVRDDHPDVWKTITGEVSTGGSSFVQGLVAAVRTAPNGQQDLVMITVGSDDKVKPGMEFIIYREDKYIVKVRVKKVMPDMVACWVIPETWNANGYKVEEGDTAQNKLF